MERGTILRQLRRKLDFTQDYIATVLEISQKHVSRVESGQAQPRIDLLERWCELLGITVRKLEKMCTKK